MQEEDAHACNHHTAQRDHNKTLRSDDVIQGAHGDSGDSCDNIGGNRKDNHFARGEAKGRSRKDRTEGKHTCKTIPKHCGGSKEEQRVRRFLRQGLHRAPELSVRIPQSFVLTVVLVNMPRLHGVKHQRQCRQQHPRCSNHHRDANMQSIRVGNAKPSDLGADQSNVQNQQQNNAADVTRSPSQTGNTAHVFFGREVVEHRVVIDRCEFKENIANAQKRNAKE